MRVKVTITKDDGTAVREDTFNATNGMAVHFDPVIVEGSMAYSGVSVNIHGHSMVDAITPEEFLKRQGIVKR